MKHLILTKVCHTLLAYHFINMNLEIVKKVREVVQCLKTNKNIELRIICIMGLNESSLTIITKSFSFISHCNISCDSPCCQNLCGENNHCILIIDTHGYVSDSDTEDSDEIIHTNDTPR